MTPSGVFVGRQSELAELQRGLAEVESSGQGRLFQLAGEPGIGKTRLADELAATARQKGALVLWGRCWESGGAPAFWPWTQILRAYLREVPMTPEAAPQLAALGPIAGLRPSGGGNEGAAGANSADDFDQARFQLFDATTTFLQQAAVRQPLVLILDDLHAADMPSLLFLRFLARELRTAPWLVLASYREFEVAHDAQRRPILAEIAREGRLLTLRGLSREDVAQYIQSSTVPSAAGAIADAVYGTSEGNPLFVNEVLHLLTQEPTIAAQVTEGQSRIAIPDQLRAIIRRRFAPLSPEAREVLAAASVIGREFDLVVLEHVVSARRAAPLHVLSILDEVCRIGLISRQLPTVGRFTFAHALIRETLYDDLGGVTQAQLHRAVGNALEAVRCADLSPYLAEVAYHFFHAAADGDVDAAVTYACRVGARAQVQFAYEEAVKHFEQALTALNLRAGGAAPGDRRRACEILLLLGDAQYGAADLVGMRATCQRAAEMARGVEGDGAALVAHAALGMGGRQQRSHAWYDDDLVRLLEESLQLLDPKDSALRARVMTRLAYALYLVPGSYERRVELCGQAVAMARRVGEPLALRWVLNDWRWALWGPATSDERMEITSELIVRAERLNDRELTIPEHFWRFVDLLERGDIVAVDSELARVRQLAHEIDRPWYLWYVGRFEALQAQLEGRFADAERLAEQSLAVAQRVRHQDAILIYSTLLLTVRMGQGRLVELEAGMQAFVANYPSVPIWQSMMAYLHVELGRLDQAKVAFDRIAVEDFRNLPRDYLMLPAASHLCEVCAVLGDRERAARLYEILLPYRQRVVVIGFGVASLGSVARYLGLLAHTMGSWQLAIEHYEEALAVNARMRARPAVAQTQCDYARALLHAPTAALARSSLASAQQLLDQAEETATAAGMIGLLSKISLLRANMLAPAAGDKASSDTAEVASAAATRQASFRRLGDYWSLQFEGELFQLQDLLGLRYMAQLLRNPQQEFHVTDLVDMGELRSAKAARPTTAADASMRGDLGDAGEILDARAKSMYKARLRDLREELVEAEEQNDMGRVERLREEMDALTQELAGAIGLGGRSRRAASHSERARVSVTKRIGIALKRIAVNDAAMARYLSSTLKTGAFCSYNPDPNRPTIWHL